MLYQQPSIQTYKGAKTLFVHGKPFMVLGGETHNSSASNLAYMEEQVWPNLAGLNMNTVLTPVYWEKLEPSEGVFDFELVDGVIAQARENNMHLIFLWFGLWKNTESTYVPRWVKKDTTRFFQARNRMGNPLNIISPFCEEAISCDASALAELMAHLKEIDGEENTVIAIQVENEIGLLGTDRDYCNAAETVFSSQIPEEIQEIYQVTGTWKDALSQTAEEVFMCYAYAKAIETITKAAQTAYLLPCYTNAWLKQFPWILGSYPCGGPVASMHPIWKRMAPSLFCLAPDIYVPHVPQVMAEYTKDENPLFVPEIRKDAITASYALYAFGKHHAIGYSPFAVEELSMDPDKIQKPPMEVMIALNIDPSAFDIRGSKECLADVYGLLQHIQPLYFDVRESGRLQSYVKQSETDFGTLLSFSEVDMLVSYHSKQAGKPLSAGWIIERENNQFYLIGFMSTIKIIPKPGDRSVTCIISMEEGSFENGNWIGRRQLNGDERMAIRFEDKLTCLSIELYQQK